MTSERPMRADAVRNRAKILHAARSRIAAHGAEVGMEDIASAAGVAVGTLYRHFATKTELVAAVLAEYTEQITQEAMTALERARTDIAPLIALADFLRQVVRISAMNQAAKDAAPALGAASTGDESRAAAALGEIIDRAIAADQVRADLTVADMYLLILSAPLSQPEDARDRWLELMLPCLTADAFAIDFAAIADRSTGSEAARS